MSSGCVSETMALFDYRFPLRLARCVCFLDSVRIYYLCFRIALCVLGLIVGW